eukprot:364299-Chlamydomonas_euryale.AAC.10
MARSSPGTAMPAHDLGKRQRRPLRQQGPPPSPLSLRDSTALALAPAPPLLPLRTRFLLLFRPFRSASSDASLVRPSGLTSACASGAALQPGQRRWTHATKAGRVPLTARDRGTRRRGRRKARDARVGRFASSGVEQRLVAGLADWGAFCPPPLECGGGGSPHEGACQVRADSCAAPCLHVAS